tara:strand:+ start:1900 stop:2046 length:147 start_codon:yes stop_codon:yes gene_type:complete
MSKLAKKNQIKKQDEIVINFISDIIVYLYFKIKNNLNESQKERKEKNV